MHYSNILPADKPSSASSTPADPGFRHTDPLTGRPWNPTNSSCFQGDFPPVGEYLAGLNAAGVGKLAGQEQAHHRATVTHAERRTFLPPAGAGLADPQPDHRSTAGPFFPTGGNSCPDEVPTACGLIDAWAERERRDRGERSRENVWRLARDLKYAVAGLGLLPRNDYLAVVDHLWRVCWPLGIDAGDLLDRVNVAYSEVTSSPTDNILTAAMRHADECWQDFTAWGVKGERAKLLALVWWLHRLAPKLEHVVVPRNLIAKWLKVSEKTCGKYIRELHERGLIRLKGDGEYSYAAKEARSAQFVGLGDDPEPVRDDGCGAAAGAGTARPEGLNPAGDEVPTVNGMPVWVIDLVGRIGFDPARLRPPIPCPQNRKHNALSRLAPVPPGLLHTPASAPFLRCR